MDKPFEEILPLSLLLKLTFASISVIAAWENRNRELSAGSTTVIFTSDALKRIRREERRKTPPEIAPKPPRNHPLLLHQGQAQARRVLEKAIQLILTKYNFGI